MLSYLFANTPLKYFVQSFWRDEAFSYVLAKQSILQLLVTTARDFNPPFYYIVLKFWMFFFGSSEIAIRSLSLIFYWATLYVVYLFLTEIFHFSGKKSALYLLFFIVNPLLGYYAYEARMYTMLAFFVTLSFYAFHERKIGLYQIAATLGLYTHYFMGLVVLTQLLTTFLWERKKPHFLFLLKKMMMPIVMFLPWIVFVLLQNRSLGDSFWIPPVTLGELLQMPALLYTGYERELGFLATNAVDSSKLLPILSLLIVGIIAYGLTKASHFHKKDQIHSFHLLLLWVLVPVSIVLLMSPVRSLFLPRYLIFVNVGLLLLLVFILDYIPLKVRIVLIAVMLFFTQQFQQLQLEHRTKTDMSRVMNEIKATADVDDVVYVRNELDFFTAQYYFDPKRVYIYGKTYEELPAFVGKSLIPKDRIVQQLPIFPVKAYVLNDKHAYDIQSLF